MRGSRGKEGRAVGDCGEQGAVGLGDQAQRAWRDALLEQKVPFPTPKVCVRVRVYVHVCVSVCLCVSMCIHTKGGG